MGLRQLLGAIYSNWLAGSDKDRMDWWKCNYWYECWYKGKGHWLKMAVRELSHGMEWMDCPLLAVNLMRLPYYGNI